jgi:hypothetical protein
MVSFLIAVGFLALILAWGYAVAGFLKVEQKLVKTAFAVVLGPAAAIVIPNALGYVMPLFTAFLITIGFFAISFPFFWHASVPLSSDHFTRKHFLLLLLVIGLAGFASARTLGSDPWCWTQSPLSSSIAAGNFPVVEPMDPSHRTTYHYGPQFFAGYIQAVSGISAEFALGIQPLLGAAGIVLCVAALIWLLTRKTRAALLCGILALAGTGFVWFNGVFLLDDLFRHFVLHDPVRPFRSLVFLYGSNITSPPLMMLGQRSTALGYAFLYGMILCVYQAFFVGTLRLRMGWGVLTIILGAALALVMETSLALLMLSIVAYIIALAFLPLLGTKHTDISWKRVLLFSIPVITLTLIIAKVQGGVFTSLSDNVSPRTFALTFSGRMYPAPDVSLGFWHWKFLRDFGLPLFFFPFALLWSWKRRAVSTFPLFLCILAVAHFLVPLVLVYLPYPPDLSRVFFGATSLFALLAGLVLNDLLDRSKRWRLFSLVCIGCLLVSALCYVLVRLTLPNLEPSVPPLFETFPAPTIEEQDLSAWIYAHTTVNDTFYIGPPEDRIDECHGERAQTLFMTRTGRGTMSSLHMSSITTNTKALLKNLEETCSVSDFQALSIRYLALINPDRTSWFASHCKAAEWSPVYGTGTSIQVLVPAR